MLCIRNGEEQKTSQDLEPLFRITLKIKVGYLVGYIK